MANRVTALDAGRLTSNGRREMEVRLTGLAATSSVRARERSRCLTRDAGSEKIAVDYGLRGLRFGLAWLGSARRGAGAEATYSIDRTGEHR